MSNNKLLKNAIIINFMGLVGLSSLLYLYQIRHMVAYKLSLISGSSQDQTKTKIKVISAEDKKIASEAKKTAIAEKKKAAAEEKFQKDFLWAKRLLKGG